MGPEILRFGSNSYKSIVYNRKPSVAIYVLHAVRLKNGRWLLPSGFAVVDLSIKSPLKADWFASSNANMPEICAILWKPLRNKPQMDLRTALAISVSASTARLAC